MKKHPENILALKRGLKINTAILVADIFSGVLLLLFLYTSFSKLVDNKTFLFSLKRSPLLYNYAGFLAIAVPVMELLIAILLFMPLTRLKGLFAATLVLIVFTFYLSYIVFYSSNLPCSCGGVISKLSWPGHIFFNLFFVILSITGIFLYGKNKTMQREIPP